METPTYILNHKLVVDLYGNWPRFHDANVPLYVPPTPEDRSLRLTLHTWQMTTEVDAKGFFVLRDHALVSFRFDGIYDSEMDAFRSGSILFEMEFFPASDGMSFQVVLDSVMDISGSFSARKGEVVSVIPCTSDGQEI